MEIFLMPVAFPYAYQVELVCLNIFITHLSLIDREKSPTITL